jgi:cytochrome c oxidase cbb3-type subunit 4
MNYDIVAAFSQVTSLLMFIAMFLAVVTYALWPANKAKFDEVQRRSLDLGNDTMKGGR